MARIAFHLSLLVLLSAHLLVASAQTCSLDIADRMDCLAFVPGGSQSDCEARNCCWDESSDPNVPWCFYQLGSGYVVESITDTPQGFNLTLNLGGIPGPFGEDSTTLNVMVKFWEEGVVEILMNDLTQDRWQVPGIVQPLTPSTAAASNFSIEFTNKPFGMIVSRRATGLVVLNTTLPGLVFEPMYISMSSSMTSGYTLYGVGEHVLPFLLPTNYTTLTEFSRDQGTPEGPMNLYGVHPFYVRAEPDGLAHGVWFLNSNAMDIVLAPTAVTWRAVGGVLHFFVVDGPSPLEVVSTYTRIIGRPYLPPRWALGFHLCRWGYGSVNNTRAVWQGMIDNQLPQDAQWNDIDYMDNHLDFTLDPINYPQDLEDDFVDAIHANGQRYVMIFDPCLSNQQAPGTYPAYELGVELDAYIKTANGSQNQIGYVWPGETVFPDFFAPNAVSYWTQVVENFHNVVPFDGMWVDMNEISSFALPVCEDEPSPPYDVGGYGPLNQKTICMGSQQAICQHYDCHSMYGYSETVVSMAALHTVLGTRSLVISRSSFAGTGSHGGHWLGDNFSSWSDLYLSIPGILNMGLFGIPLVGADVCGFNGNTTAELCTRWMQLGAFYPFYRNHNTIGASSQAPYVFGDPYTSYIRSAMNVRYSLIPYLYTAFYEASVTGVPVARALTFAFPPSSLGAEIASIDKQFMFGPSLLISPCLQEGATTVEAFFPSGLWYDWFTGLSVVGEDAYVVLSSPLSTINVHVLGGSIVPIQEPAMSTAQQTFNNLTYVVALNDNGDAAGSLFLDDGISLNAPSTLLSLSAASKGMVGAVAHTVVGTSAYPDAAQMQVTSLLIYGLADVASNTVFITNAYGDVTYTFDESAQTLVVTGFVAPCNRAFTLSWKPASE